MMNSTLGDDHREQVAARHHVDVFVYVSVYLCVDQGVNVDGKRPELHSSGT